MGGALQVSPEGREAVLCWEKDGWLPAYGYKTAEGRTGDALSWLNLTLFAEQDLFCNEEQMLSLSGGWALVTSPVPQLTQVSPWLSRISEVFPKAMEEERRAWSYI